MYRIAKTVVADHPCLLVGSGLAFLALWHFLLCHQPSDVTANGVVLWWTVLCAVSVANVCGWRISAVALARRKPATDPAFFAFQRWQLLLSAVYVVGCGFRSILPRADVQRIGLVDSWVSSVLVGRSVATVAELCFVAQWALLLRVIARDAQSPLGVGISRLLLPLIAVAELCSWYAVLTTSYVGNAVEESIWALSASLVIVCCVTLWSRCRAAWRPLLAAALVLGIAYVAFMCLVDIPMYLTRWLEDEASGRTYLSLSQGFQDVWSRRVVTFAWDEWRTEIPWMTLYFSVGVWCSIALVHAPRLQPMPRPLLNNA
jgi:hypothetical protein